MVQEKIWKEKKTERLTAEKELDALMDELQRVNTVLAKQMTITSAQATKIIKLEAEIAALTARNLGRVDV